MGLEHGFELSYRKKEKGLMKKALKICNDHPHLANYSSLKYKIPTLLPHYCIFIGLSVQFNLIYLLGHLHILLQNPHSDGFAFLTSLLQYCSFTPPPFFLFLFTHCCPTQHCSGPHNLSIQNSSTLKIEKQDI